LVLLVCEHGRSNIIHSHSLYLPVRNSSLGRRELGLLLGLFIINYCHGYETRLARTCNFSDLFFVALGILAFMFGSPRFKVSAAKGSAVSTAFKVARSHPVVFCLSAAVPD
jgi:hypothetical protein